MALAERITLREGVYVAVGGPNLETRAEYPMLRLMGADVVGMSTVPEVIAAVHAGMRVLGISIITDMGLADALEPADIQPEGHRPEIHRGGKERGDVPEVLPLGAVQPDVLVVLGELDHVPDRPGGFLFLVDVPHHVGIFCHFPRHLDVAAEGRELVEDVVAGDAVEQF